MPCAAKRLGDEPGAWLEAFMNGRGQHTFERGMSGCATVTDLGVVRDVLTAVDCNTKSFARLGYESRNAAVYSALLSTALTAALTIYVAVIGYRLLFSGAMARGWPTRADHRAEDRRGVERRW